MCVLFELDVTESKSINIKPALFTRFATQGRVCGFLRPAGDSRLASGSLPLGSRIATASQTDPHQSIRSSHQRVRFDISLMFVPQQYLDPVDHTHTFETFAHTCICAFVK